MTLSWVCLDRAAFHACCAIDRVTLSYTITFATALSLLTLSPPPLDQLLISSFLQRVLRSLVGCIYYPLAGYRFRIPSQSASIVEPIFIVLRGSNSVYTHLGVRTVVGVLFRGLVGSGHAHDVWVYIQMKRFQYFRYHVLSNPICYLTLKFSIR